MSIERRVFTTVLGRYDRGGIWVGVNGISGWGTDFAQMRQNLESAGLTPEQLLQVRSLLRAAIDASSERELKADERIALHAVLDTAFDRMPREYDTTRAPKAEFLRHVRFAGE
jgi:hypothetical protein